MGIEGRSVIDCEITSAGKLRDCRATLEEPDAWGFGQAAVGLASFFVLEQPAATPWSPGRRIQVPISFRLPPVVR
jgi:hypothetical protein